MTSFDRNVLTESFGDSFYVSGLGSAGLAGGPTGLGWAGLGWLGLAVFSRLRGLGVNKFCPKVVTETF